MTLSTCPACRAHAVAALPESSRSAVIWILARVFVGGQDEIVANLCESCAGLFDGSVSAFWNWRAKDADGPNLTGVDFDELVLWLATKKKDVIHLEVMNDHDLFIDIAGVIFNLHVTRKGAVLRLNEGRMNEDGTFAAGRQ